MSTRVENKPVSSWDSYSVIKKSAIVITASAVTAIALSYIQMKGIMPFCQAYKSGLGSYVCLKSSNFFNIENLETAVNSIVDLRDDISKFIQPLFFFIPYFRSSACRELELAIPRIAKREALANTFTATNKLKTLYENACIKNAFDPKETTCHAIAEEVIWRFILQGVIRLATQKIPTLFNHRNKSIRAKLSNTPNTTTYLNKIGKNISNPYSRTLIISFLFAFWHTNSKDNHNPVLNQFISGLFLGTLFEKFGFFYGTMASSTAHVTMNLISKSRFGQPLIEDSLNGILAAIKNEGL